MFSETASKRNFEPQIYEYTFTHKTYNNDLKLTNRLCLYDEKNIGSNWVQQFLYHHLLYLKLVRQNIHR